jgi:hypothetical protein
MTSLPKVRISAVEPAICPEDGKWAVYCDHLDETTGEWLNGGLIQDNNKRILAPWRHAKFSNGLTQWCGLCQEITQTTKEEG